MSETLTIEQLLLDELRAAFTRVAEHTGFALFMAERAVCKAFRQFADVKKESTTTREILTRLSVLEGEAGDAILKDRAILSALCGDDSLALEADAPTKRQQVAERFLAAAVGNDNYKDTAEWLNLIADWIYPEDVGIKEKFIRAMAAVLEEAAREEQDA